MQSHTVDEEKSSGCESDYTHLCSIDCVTQYSSLHRSHIRTVTSSSTTPSRRNSYCSARKQSCHISKLHRVCSDSDVYSYSSRWSKCRSSNWVFGNVSSQLQKQPNLRIQLGCARISWYPVLFRYSSIDLSSSNVLQSRETSHQIISENEISHSNHSTTTSTNVPIQRSSLSVSNSNGNRRRETATTEEQRTRIRREEGQTFRRSPIYSTTIELQQYQQEITNSIRVTRIASRCYWATLFASLVVGTICFYFQHFMSQERERLITLREISWNPIGFHHRIDQFTHHIFLSRCATFICLLGFCISMHFIYKTVQAIEKLELRLVFIEYASRTQDSRLSYASERDFFLRDRREQVMSCSLFRRAAMAAISIPYLFVYLILCTQPTLLLAHEHNLQGLQPCWGKPLATSLVRSLQEREVEGLLSEQTPIPIYSMNVLYKHGLSCETHYPLLCRLHYLWPNHVICNVTTGHCYTDASWIYEAGVKCKMDFEEQKDIHCYFPSMKEVRKGKLPRFCKAYFDLTHTADASLTSLLLILAFTIVLVIAHYTLCAISDMQKAAEQSILSVEKEELVAGEEKDGIIGSPELLESQTESSNCEEACSYFFATLCARLARFIVTCVDGSSASLSSHRRIDTGKKD